MPLDNTKTITNVTYNGNDWPVGGGGFIYTNDFTAVKVELFDTEFTKLVGVENASEDVYPCLEIFGYDENGDEIDFVSGFGNNVYQRNGKIITSAYATDVYINEGSIYIYGDIEFLINNADFKQLLYQSV